MDPILRSAFSESSARVLYHAGCHGPLMTAPQRHLVCGKCNLVIESPSEITGHPPIERESTRTLGWARIQDEGEL